MRLVSLKKLIASLIGCAFVVMKVVTFDGFVDLFWIAFIGYLSVKELFTAFSQKAYDEDVKETQQAKILYRDLFGRFAYIAADIPISLILLAGLLAVFCPATALLRVILTVLLFAALGYAIWLSWYVSRNKRQRMKNGEWGTGVLSAEDERAWRYADLWHWIFLGVLGAACVFCLIFGNPKIYLNNAKLKKALSTPDSESVTLEESVPFEWTSAYTFEPYTSISFIEWATGSKSPALKESVSEGMTHVVFTNHGQVVASVCAYPASLGYYLTFTGGKSTYYADQNGGYYRIQYGDEIVFDVTQEDGFVRLNANGKMESLTGNQSRKDRS